MASPINDDPAAAIEFAPKAAATAAPELPKAIPTEATEFVPKGRIIDDSARGTIFWEAERDDLEGVDEEDDVRSNRSEADGDASSPTKTWGKPFKVEWVSTTRLPFYRTRGLRNPWNSNREVKIARDGTELETSVGRRLLDLFQRQPSPVIPTLPTVQGLMPMLLRDTLICDSSLEHRGCSGSESSMRGKSQGRLISATVNGAGYDLTRFQYC